MLLEAVFKREGLVAVLTPEGISSSGVPRQMALQFIPGLGPVRAPGAGVGPVAVTLHPVRPQLLPVWQPGRAHRALFGARAGAVLLPLMLKQIVLRLERPHLWTLLALELLSRRVKLSLMVLEAALGVVLAVADVAFKVLLAAMQLVVVHKIPKSKKRL